MFNSALRRHPDEASLIGQLLLGYGELERAIAVLLGESIGDRRPAFRMMFRILGETARINAADAMIRHKYCEVGLESEYADAIGAVRFCVKVRNQFGHCHWADDVHAGVFFANFQETAKSEDNPEQDWFHIDCDLAGDLLAYFEHTFKSLHFLEIEYLVRSGRGSFQSNFLLKPQKCKQPRLHNPPEQHIPPWLAEDERQRYIARAQGKKRAQMVLDESPKSKDGFKSRFLTPPSA